MTKEGFAEKGPWSQDLMGRRRGKSTWVCGLGQREQPGKKTTGLTRFVRSDWNFTSQPIRTGSEPPALWQASAIVGNFLSRLGGCLGPRSSLVWAAGRVRAGTAML